MDVIELVKSYLQKVNIMQLATAVDNQPWACTVHFASDDQLNLYWTSKTDRRHSKEIEKNNKVSVTVPIEDNQKGGYVIGVSFEGTASKAEGGQEELAHNLSVKKLKRDPNRLEAIRSGKEPHNYYVLKPSKIVLFDSKNFPDDPRKEIQL